jgi:hypothetical protein
MKRGPAMPTQPAGNISYHFARHLPLVRRAHGKITVGLPDVAYSFTKAGKDSLKVGSTVPWIGF